MLHSFSGFFLAVIFTFMLVSCAGVDENLRDSELFQETIAPKGHATWDASNHTQNYNKAVQDLLHQADTLMEQRQLEKASDKLERLLSIDPSNAQAWSRLSWIALQANKLGKTHQMAQRSNSHASGNNQLKILNWSFIREAARRSGDVATIRRAEQMIDSLNTSGDSL